MKNITNMKLKIDFKFSKKDLWFLLAGASSSQAELSEGNRWLEAEIIHSVLFN